MFYCCASRQKLNSRFNYFQGRWINSVKCMKNRYKNSETKWVHGRSWNGRQALVLSVQDMVHLEYLGLKTGKENQSENWTFLKKK